MTTRPNLAVVPPSTAHTLRQLILERDRLVAAIATLDALIAPQARAWADERGEMMVPRLERLRRELAV